jgi:two-component system, cell cycle sensor histidine kinase and response regulator CckA
VLSSSDTAAAVARLAAIVESSDDGIIGKTLDGTITDWNRGAERMYGYPASEMIGRSVLRIFPPDLVPDLDSILNRIRLGERVEHFETRRVRKDGTAIDVSVSISPIRDQSGVIVGAATVARDVTDRNRAEADRRLMEARLRYFERMETIGQVATGIVTGVNNALSVILGCADLITGTTREVTTREDTAQIRAAAEDAARLTWQMLIFSRRERTRPEPLDVNAVLADLRALLQASLRGDMELRLEPSSGIPPIRADRLELEQVLLKLTVNARDAIEGGGIVTIATRPVLLGPHEAGLDPEVDPGWYAELAVTDTGVGLTDTVASRIFEPFFEARPTGQGTSLGLYTVHHIIAKAGGGVRVESAPGAGTTVRAYLPAARATTAAAAAPVTAPGLAPAATGQIIIIVEEPPMHMVIARILRNSGYVTFAADGDQDALALLAAHDVGLLIVGCSASGSGDPASSIAPGFAERVSQIRPGVRTLYTSASGQGTVEPERLLTGELAFIQKPFTSAALLAKVRAVLDEG